MNAWLSNVRVAILLIIGIVGVGLYSLSELARESWPDVEIPIGMITAVYPGASPELVEAEVTNILERNLKGVPGLTALKSSSMESVSIVLVEFSVDARMRESLDTLADRLEEARAELPDDVEDVKMVRVATSNQPIFSFALSGELPPETIREAAVALRDELEGVSGVSEVRISGMQDSQLQVLVHQQRLEEIGGTLDDVVSSLQNAQATAPLGRYQSTRRNFPLDVEPVGLDMVRLGELPVRAASSGDMVSLSSVARLQRALAEPTEHTRLVNRLQGTAGAAISFEILRQPGANVPDVVTDITTILSQTVLPDGLTLTVTADRSEEINAGLALLFSNGWQAVALVCLVLFAVLGLREALIAGLSVPLTFLATFGVLLALGQSLNNLSMMALVIAMGLLVDDFILVMEGMHEELEAGHTPLQAARGTLKSFALPSLSGTLTTLAAFFPMAMLGGMEGRFVRVIPLTICIALILSYLISITIDTSVGAALLRRAPPGRLTAWVGRLMAAAQDFYESQVFPRTLATARLRWRTLAVAGLVSSLSLVAAGQLDTIVYPDTDEIQLGATFHLPPGSTLAEGQALSAQVEAALSDDPSIAHLTLTAGHSSGLAMSGPDSYLVPFEGEDLLGLTMQLVPASERTQSSVELAEVYRRELEDIAGGSVEIHQIRMGTSSGAPVELQVTARSQARAEELADAVIAAMHQVEGIAGVTDSRSPHQGAWRVALSDEAIRFHDQDRSSVLKFLRYAISGTAADTVYEGDDAVDIMVGYDWRGDGIWNSPASIDDILSLEVPGFFGEPVPVAALGELELKSAALNISHLDRRHVVTVSAQTTGRSPVGAAQEVVAITDALSLSPGEAITPLGDFASSQETSREMGQAMLMALALIFCILVVQFRSFLQPLIILAALPLAMTGVFFGFLLSGIPLSFPAMIGMVALAGIVVNDSIVLVDTMNRHVAAGAVPLVAVQLATTERLRPILVTTVTTVIGLLPLAMTDAVWEGLCMAVVYGISIATLLTLVVIPAMYLTLKRAP
ncbi:MAG: multidrug efflux pump subunit AcrB [Myxococcota bacterium]|jgi:multidrug efflux pump subunit AcrB